VRRIGKLTVYEGLEDIPESFGPSALTIGVFDGVHRGHQALMATVIAKARELDAVPAVVTFDRHPLEIIAPGKEPPLLTTLPQRARVMESVGIEALVVLRFDDELRTLSPEDFVGKILVEQLQARHVVVGANFRFGHQQAGTIETLNDLGPAYGFDTTIFALQMGGTEEVVSSTLIRRHIADGEVERAGEELERPYRIEGHVERGAGRGKGLGYPTANLRIPARMLLPKLGVYVVRVRRRDAVLPGVANVGLNPTFEDRRDPVIEVFILDFDEDLYGEVVEVEFTHRLRDEQKFPDPAALVQQIRRDVEAARAWHAANPPS